MSKCINCSHDVDKSGICTKCVTRHEFCKKCELFIAKVNPHQQYCPICGTALEPKNQSLANIFLETYSDYVKEIKNFIDSHNQPIYEYQIFDLMKDRLIDGYRFSTGKNHMTLPNMLKFAFSKKYGYHKIGRELVIFRDANGKLPDIEVSTKPVICTTEVYEALDWDSWYMQSEWADYYEDIIVPDGFKRLTRQQAQDIAYEYRKTLEDEALERFNQRHSGD